MLRTLVLARNHDARRQVRNTNGRVGDIDVLTAGPARPEGIDPDGFFYDVDVDILRQLRPCVERRERGMAARRLVERRNPHETMNTDLSGEQAVGVLAGDEERHALQT